METHTLDNGLRIICSPSATDVVYCGIAVDAGTRDEQPDEFGMAHFTEHLTFKSTTRRRAWHILNRMESVGGDLNAFTGKEETVYYTTFLRPHFSRAIDLLVDVVFNSTYPQHEMDKEVEVVIDEIESYNDSPSELIYDEFENMVFSGHALGRNILGDADGLRSMRSENIQRFVSRMYTPDRMVLFVYGNVPMKTVVREVKKALAMVKAGVRFPDVLSLDNISNKALPRVAPLAGMSERAETREVDMSTHQAHVMMGMPSFSATDPRHLHLYLLNNILGGPGMNSRLNLALRERNGLVYTVESSSTAYTDTGLWSVYFGCDPHDVKRCQRLVMRELQRLTDSPLSESALSAAKRQLVGQIGISFDSFENVAIGMAKRYLHYNQTLTCQELCQKVKALTREELFDTARQLFNPQNITTLIYD